MTPQSLPPLEQLAQHPAFQGDGYAQTAYCQLIPLQNKYSGDNLVKIRLSGWMLVHAPCEEGRHYVARSINDCVNEEMILDLGDYHLKYFVSYFTHTAIPLARPSPRPSRPSLEALHRAITDGLVAPAQNHTEAKDQALVRDDYCCVVTKCTDSTCYINSPWLRGKVSENCSPGVKPTQCSYIIPKHTNRAAKVSTNPENSSNVWTILVLLGGFDPLELNGQNIHNLGNILTLAVDVRIAFDSLMIWFEPIENAPNHYTVQKQFPALLSELPQQVEFTSTNEAKLPVPNPRYLALHAACAKMLHMSGASEVIDRVLDDHERTEVLATDGSSSELLEYLLFETEIVTQ